MRRRESQAGEGNHASALDKLFKIYAPASCVVCSARYVSNGQMTILTRHPRPCTNLWQSLLARPLLMMFSGGTAADAKTRTVLAVLSRVSAMARIWRAARCCLSTHQSNPEQLSADEKPTVLVGLQNALVCFDGSLCFE